MPRRSFLLLVGFLLSLVPACQPSPHDRVTLTISAGASGRDLELTVAGTQRFMKSHPEIRVLVVPTPRTSRERLDYYQSLFDSQSDEIDVMQIDVVWTGIVAANAVDLKGLIPRSKLDRMIPSTLESATVDGRLVAIPWYADVPSLYCRTDLLQKYGIPGPPRTWKELEQAARKIMDGERRDGNLGFWGYIWQGMAYEGLTCNALEWQNSHGGGNFVGTDGRAHVSNPETAAAFAMAASWIGTISPPSVLQSDEEESRLLWQRGDAAFMRNWAYAYSQTVEAGPIGKSFTVVPIPAGPARQAGTLGGWQLMVSAFSRHPKEAAALIEFLSDEAEQRTRAIEGSYGPTVVSLYSDPQVLAAVPLFKGYQEAFNGLVVRPSSQTGRHYDRVSSVYSSAVFDVLSGNDPAARLQAAEAEMNQLLHR